MKKIVFAFTLLLIGNIAFAQDFHLSQVYAAPLTLNPALSGSMPGKYRATAQYRNQWQTVMDNSFKTIQASFDVKTKVKGSFTDHLGFGMYFFSDKGGTTNLSTNHLAVTAAYHKGLGVTKKRYLSAGINIGIAQKNINYNDLTFQDQFDGTTGYTLAGAEPFITNNRSYPDFSTGVHYTYIPKNDVNFSSGISISHFNVPNVALDDEVVNRLPTKVTLYGSGELPLSDRLNLLPRALIHWQGPNLEANVGTNFKFKLGYDNAFHIGTWLRPVLDEKSGVALDAFVLLFGFETETVQLGLSTDSNLSSLVRSSSGFGGFELSLTYMGRDRDNDAMCPTF